MIRNLSVLILLLLSFSAFSQQYYSLNNPDKQAIKILSSSSTECIIEFNYEGFYLSDVQTTQGIKKSIKMENASSILLEGEPEILKTARSIIIPDMGEMDFKILSSDFVEYQNIEIVPSKGNLYRDVDPSTVNHVWGRTYQENGIFPASPISLSDPYILKDYRGLAINVFPVQYNHASQSIKVYKKIIVRIYKSTSTGGINQLSRNQIMQKVDEHFDPLYQNHFLNYNFAKYTSIPERGNFLIISDPSYISAMAPFVQWKNRIGFPTEIVSTAITGTSSSNIKTYVTNYYNNNGLSFLLFVGDEQHITTINSGVGGPSDNAYAYISGSDHYPEFYVGRFSAESTIDVDIMVERTIDYELNPNTSSNWLNRNMGIASSQGPGDDNEYDYEHIRNMQIDLDNYEYITKYELFDGSQGGLDASGDPSASNVATVINNGVGLINYCGHGSDYSWVSSGFSNTNINALSNNGEWPIIFSVACVNGNFIGKTCFAEAWLRAKNGSGDPTGAVAVIMSTINQSWDPPMDAQDEMVDVLAELNTSNIKHSFAGIVMSGCMKMNDTYGSNGDAMTDTWTVFGDPSLMIRTDTPKTMTVTHAPTTFIGATQFTVNCDVENAFVCITLNDQIIGTGSISGGSSIISFPALIGIDTLIVAITHYNYIPYIGEVPIISSSGPYISYDSHSINDVTANNNGEADYQESFLLNLTLSNSGVNNATAVTANLSTTDPAITITDTTEYYGSILSSSTSTKNDAYAITVSNTVPDGHLASININSIDGASSWNSSFNITINAPALAIGNLTIDDAAGNNDGKLDPNENSDIIFESLNNGHANYPSANGVLTSTSTFVNITSGSASLGTMNALSNTNATFTIHIDPACPMGTSIDLTYTLGTGYYQVQECFYLKVGVADEDYESGDLSQYAWSVSGNQAWFVSTETPYEGTYCVKSGNISDNQNSIMSIDMNLASPDSISFYYKVSCEDGSSYGDQYDYLEFKIDNSSKDWWDGEKAWARAAYATSSGQHTFSWIYDKDPYVSDGSDAAWVDYVVFPPMATTTGIEQNTNVSFNIYPNPTNSISTIQINAHSSEYLIIDLQNEIGQSIDVIFEGQINEGISQIQYNFDALSQGIYFVRINGDSGQITRMLMIGQ